MKAISAKKREIIRRGMASSAGEIMAKKQLNVSLKTEMAMAAK